MGLLFDRKYSEVIVMTQATMNIFQTYKALMLKKAWEQDLKALKIKPIK